MDNESGIWVPAEQLAQAERVRDEARAELARLRHDPKADARQVIEEWRAKAERAWSDAGQAQERLGLATALLREWREDDGLPAATHTSKRGRTDAFLAGLPAPAKVTVDDAMVERAQTAYTDTIVRSMASYSDELVIHPMRAALAAALEGRT